MSPRLANHKARVASTATVARAQPSAAPLILVVDDFPDSREMYAEYLEFSGYRTAQAGDGAEALAKATELRPDVILMDLSLPVLDGWEATRRLKSNPETRGIRVVAVTGHALDGHSKKASDAGCDSFIAKPCLPEDVLGVVKKLLGEPTALESAQRKP